MSRAAPAGVSAGIAAAAAPVPWNTTVSGLEGASVGISRDADLTPCAVGLNTADTWHDAPGVRSRPEQSSSTKVKSPGFRPASDNDLMLRLPAPVLVTVRVCDGELAPGATSPKRIQVSEMVTCGPLTVPVPARATVADAGGFAKSICNVPAAGPDATGRNTS